MASFTFMLDPVSPFRIDLTAWALRRRRDNRTDLFDDGEYSRILSFADTPVEILLSQKGAPETAHIEVHVQGAKFTTSLQVQIALILEKIFGMGTDLSGFYAVAKHDPRLGLLAKRFLGLKPPRFPTVFEAVVNGIACQQLSLTVGIILLDRLAGACALSMQTNKGIRHAFPRPQDVVKLSTGDLRALGFSVRKALTLLELSRAIIGGKLDLEGLASLGRQEAVEYLTSLRGIGRWTAEYVLLRGLGDLSTFPGDDVGGRNKLQRWLEIRETLSYEDIHKVTSRWKPYPGLVYFHLLLDELAKEGYVSDEPYQVS